MEGTEVDRVVTAGAVGIDRGRDNASGVQVVLYFGTQAAFQDRDAGGQDFVS